ncbi:hypothetical protein, partial [Klebsiella pneumoniae]
SKRPSISFAKFAAVENGTAILLLAAEGKAAQEAESVVGQALLSRIIDVSDFKGKLAASLSTLAPGGTELDRLV